MDDKQRDTASPHPCGAQGCLIAPTKFLTEQECSDLANLVKKLRFCWIERGHFFTLGAATYQDGEIVLCVVNRHKDEAIATDLIAQTGEFSGVFEVYEVNGPDIKTMNDFGKEPVKTVRKEDVKAKGETVTYAFPPHSFTMIKGSIR